MIDGHLTRLANTLETSDLNKYVSQMSNAVSATKPSMEAINSIKPFTERMTLANKLIKPTVGKTSTL